jgi:predicted aspartyl protease
LEIIQCWQMNAELGIIIIPIRIINPKTKISIIKNCIFDTGFSGYIGLDQDTILMLKLNKVGVGKGISIDRSIEIENFEAIAELIDKNQAQIAKIENIDKGKGEENKYLIPVQSINLPIIGMRVISQFRWVIISDRKIICLIK